MGRNRKLTPMEEFIIFKLRKQENMKAKEVAKKYNISTRTVRRICNRQANQKKSKKP
jgi:DNA invertase Pin-like site-specific DNA recombinase